MSILSILELLGLKRGGRPMTAAGDTETVRHIVAELGALDPERARYVAAFAFLLSRVAHADLHVSDDETRKMERILQEVGHLPEEQAALAVRIAQVQWQRSGGTENFLVSREFKEIATREQCEELLRCLFAVSAADESISGVEEAQIRQTASELGFTLEEYVAARSAFSHHRQVLKGLGRPG
jgi:uncharacterized tellurite resistance protein B-like protein